MFGTRFQKRIPVTDRWKHAWRTRLRFLKPERKLPGLRALKESANRPRIERNAALPELCRDRRPRRSFFSQPSNLVQERPEQALERLRMGRRLHLVHAVLLYFMSAKACFAVRLSRYEFRLSPSIRRRPRLLPGQMTTTLEINPASMSLKVIALLNGISSTCSHRRPPLLDGTGRPRLAQFGSRPRDGE
jgi:hypothetical protein